MADIAPPTTESSTASARLPRLEIAVLLGVSAAIIAMTALQWWPDGWRPSDWVEVASFITGIACVWLIVRQHIWNWPLGLANNVTFFIVFHQSRLYADAYLQIAYFALGVYGWWHWLRGGEQRTGLRVSHAPRLELALLVAAAVPATWALRLVLIEAGGAAPFFDALTTVLSLAAQFLTCRKRIESWLVWITADLIYIPLYLSRGLPLTAALYTVFLIMCIAGWREWRAAYAKAHDHER